MGKGKELLNIPKGNVPLNQLKVGTKINLVGYDMKCNYVWTPAILEEVQSEDLVVISSEGIDILYNGNTVEYKIV